VFLEFLAKPTQQYIESSVDQEFCQTAWLESCKSWDRPMWLSWQAEVGLRGERWWSLNLARLHGWKDRLPDAIEVGADLHGHYHKLKLDSGVKSDEAL